MHLNKPQDYWLVSCRTSNMYWLQTIVNYYCMLHQHIKTQSDLLNTTYVFDRLSVSCYQHIKQFAVNNQLQQSYCVCVCWTSAGRIFAPRHEHARHLPVICVPSCFIRVWPARYSSIMMRSQVVLDVSAPGLLPCYAVSTWSASVKESHHTAVTDSSH